MTMLISRRSALGSAAATGALALAGTPARAQADPLKAAWIYVGPVGDFGWSYRHDIGRRAVQETLGDKVVTSYVESVPEGPDAERVLRQLATTGNRLIFATSFGFMNSVVRVARQFPDVKFEHATGTERADNISTYAARFYEGRAVIGTMAGTVTKSGIVGYVAPFPIPEVVRGVNSFILAARKQRPDIRVKLVWANAWYDPGKEADAAKALIDQGADVISQHTDSPAPLQVAQERGVVGFGQASDMSAYAPEAQLTSIVDNWDQYYTDRAQSVIDGTWTSTDTWLGLKSGMVEMAPYGPKVTPEVAAEADKVRDAIVAGTLHPFAGPITDQKGEVRVAEGAVASDEELLKMDWWVPGVEGQLGG
jgi:simple sugar transport system substrate-binding protein